LGFLKNRVFKTLLLQRNY